MRLKTEKMVLLNGIQTVQNIISPKSALPILSNILMSAQQGSLRLTATDLDIGISCVLSVDTPEAGMVTVPAKRFGDIIRELPAGDVDINTKKNNSVTITSGLCQFKIMGMPGEEFPKLPEFKDREAIKIEQAVLKEMLGLTAFAVSLDETRYILNGILFKIEQNKITLVATDGKRLALIEKKLRDNSGKSVSVIIPVKTIHELSRNLQEDGEVSLILNNNQVLFDLGKVVIISRLIEGEFPDYHQVIPEVCENQMKVSRNEFLLGVKRASLLATPDYQAVKLELFKDKLVISKSTPDIGESREELSVEYKGKELAVGFNPGYLIDVLKNLPQEEVGFELSDSEKPGVIRMGDYTYIVLPMRLA